MNIKIAFLVTGIVSAAAGFAAGYFVSKQKAVIEIDRICDETTEEIREMEKKIQSLEEKIAVPDSSLTGVNPETWAKIAVDMANEKAELDAPVNEEITAFNKDSDIMRKPDKESRVDYASKFDAPKSDISEGVDNLLKTMANDHGPSEPIIRRPNKFKVVYSPDWDDDEDDCGYDEEYLNFYIDSENLYLDMTDSYVPEEEVPKYTGMSLDEVRDLFHKHRNTYPNTEHEWRIVNRDLQMIYILNECAGVGPRP